MDSGHALAVKLKIVYLRNSIFEFIFSHLGLHLVHGEHVRTAIFYICLHRMDWNVDRFSIGLMSICPLVKRMSKITIFTLLCPVTDFCLLPLHQSLDVMAVIIGYRSIRPRVDPPRVDPLHVRPKRGRSAPTFGTIRPKFWVVPPQHP